MSNDSQFCTQCGAKIEAGTKFCSGCGQTLEVPAPSTAASPPQAANLPRDDSSIPSPSSGMSVWIWGILGVIIACGILFGAFKIFHEGPPPGAAYDNLSPAEKEKKLKEILDDLPDRDEVDLEKATHPTDLPEKLQKKFDNSMLSDEHNKAVDAAVGPLPKLTGELVNTKRPPTVTDDFTSPLPNWKTGNDAKARREIKDGQIQIAYLGERGTAQVLFEKTVKNFAVQVDATPVAGEKPFSYGVVVRRDATGGRFIIFLVSPNSQYAVVKFENGKSSTVAKGKSALAIKPGLATNTLKVDVREDYFSFEVNGKIVEVQKIEGFPEGQVALALVTSPNDPAKPTQVSFDNFKLWEQP